MKISTLIINISYLSFFLNVINSAVVDLPEYIYSKETLDESIGSTVEESYQNPTPTQLEKPSLSLPREGLERPDHQCGLGLGSPPCGHGRCCSVNGWCGDTFEYCRGSNCRYQCWESSVERSPNILPRKLLKSGSYGVGQIVSESVFEAMFKHRKDCPSRGFYSYDAFIAAAASFPGFGTTGDVVARKRELAAFFGQTSQATTATYTYINGQWSKSEQHSWGYCHINKSIGSEYCTSPYWPCATGKSYNARGPIQLIHNHNYGKASEALGLDLINNPELVATNPIVSFKTALWFWMTNHDNNPSCHTIVVNANSKNSDHNYNFYVPIGSIIRAETSFGTDTSLATSNIGYYKRYCDLLGVSYGENLKHWYDHDHDYDHDDHDQRTYPDVAKTEIWPVIESHAVPDMEIINYMSPGDKY